MAKNDFQYSGWNSYTLQCGTIMSLISPGDCTLQCGMWLGEPGNMTVNSPSGSTLQCNMWLWDNMLLTSPGCSTLQCVRWLWDDMSNVRHIGILHLVSISTISPQSTCHFATVCEILFKSDQKKMTSCRFSRWRISAIWDIRGPIISLWNSQCTTSYRSSIETIALNCLLFEEITFFCILATDRRRDGQHRCTKPLSLSRAAA